MVLALGGNGFIGHNFVKRFALKEKIRVFGKEKKYQLEEKNIEFLEGDFRYADFDSLLEGVDSVFHFISSIVPFDGTEGIIEDIEMDLIPTIKLLESMKQKKVKKIFFVSSGGTIYGECKTPANENSKLMPECVYALQKISIENYLHLYEKYDGIQCYILRISNPYGLEVNVKRKQGIIPIFTQKIFNREPVEIWGNGDNRRDYIYIDEVIDAIESIYQYKGKYRVFNIGSGVSYSIHEIIQLVEKEINIQAKVEYKDKRRCDLLNSCLDVSLIYQECGWKSKLTIEQGIKNYVDKFLNQHQI